MASTQKEGKLLSLLRQISDNAEGDKIKFSNVVKAIEHRGFGALLIVPALLVILPTGGIPGLPTLCAIFMILISGQIVMGQSHPWLPKKIRNYAVPKDKFDKAVEKCEPVLKAISRVIKPRLKIIVVPDIAKRSIAVLIILLSVACSALELVPFAAFFPGATILMLAIGLTFRDGAFVVVGGTLCVLTAIFAPMLFLNQ